MVMRHFLLALTVAVAPFVVGGCNEPYEEDTSTSESSITAVDVGWAPLYKQDDPRWKEDPYVFNSEWWLGYVGCTLTAMSMGAAWVEYTEWSPKWTNASPENFAYTLATVDQYIRHLGKGLRWLNERHPASETTLIAKDTPEHKALVQEILAALRRGNPVIVGVTYSTPVGPAGWTRHTMLATGIDDDEWILVNDPATGTRHRLVDYTSMWQFGGYDLAEEIAYYR
jgi:hypothetical protein